MKHNSIKFLTVFLMSFMVVIPSCMDLDESPENKLPPESFYLTPGQCQNALAGTMNRLAERVYQPEGVFEHPDWPDGTMNGTLIWGNSYQVTRWSTYYLAISNINPVIKSINNGNLSTYAEKEVNDVLGQAHFLRGWCYFFLVRLYGKIPYITETTPDVLEFPLTPSSREEVSAVYDKIESDLLNAIAKMPVVNAEDLKAAPGKPNIWSAKALLARVYITRATAPLKQPEYYAKARDLANDVIENSPYKFTEDIQEIFKLENVKANPEFIWQFLSSDDHYLAVSANFGPGVWGGYGAGSARALWANSYPEQPRKYCYILMAYPFNLAETADPDEWEWRTYLDGSGGNNPYNGKRLWPHVPRDITITQNNINPPLPLIRYTDMLLVYAEAANMANGGPTQLAVDRINKVIDRGNKPYVSVFAQTSIAGTQPQATLSMSKEDFNDMVLAERTWELCFENETFFDVLRTETLEQVNEPDISVNFKPSNYLFPIPDIDALQIGNNPGYN